MAEHPHKDANRCLKKVTSNFKKLKWNVVRTTTGSIARCFALGTQFFVAFDHLKRWPCYRTVPGTGTVRYYLYHRYKLLHVPTGTCTGITTQRYNK